MFSDLPQPRGSKRSLYQNVLSWRPINSSAPIPRQRKLKEFRNSSKHLHQTSGLILTNDLDWRPRSCSRARRTLNGMNSTTSVCFLRRRSQRKQRDWIQEDGAPGRTRTCGILLRRSAVQNSKCRPWCRLGNRHLPRQRSVNWFYNNLQESVDCQTTRKPYRTSSFVG
jgi:hypothetical protein